MGTEKAQNSHMAPDDILFPYLQTAKLCTPANLVLSGFQEPGVLRSSVLGIVMRVVRTVKWRAITEGACVVNTAHYHQVPANGSRISRLAADAV